MPTVSFDAQSLLIDGRRLWLVSGAIHYPRVPPELWRDRIRAAKQAGLNCIETYVFWNAHEPRPGSFDFSGGLDLRRFVQTIGQEGMFCILRPGPYICAEWDNGGLPAWLGDIEGLKPRQANAPFLSAAARYLSAVMAQVHDLQVTGSLEQPGLCPPGVGGAGPIILMQAENEWFCHNPSQADTYLGELVRYLREDGCEVPIVCCNNLWQRVPGTIDTWNGAWNLSANLRQLHAVQPHAPRLVTEYWPGWFDAWGREHDRSKSAELNLYRLAGILAAGGQYNIYMFHGGTNFGFWGGRTVGGPAVHMTTSYDYDAPLLEAGGRGAKYLVVKRLSTFASQFGQILAHLHADRPHAAVALDEKDHGLSVIQQDGTQGSVVFLFRGNQDQRQTVDLMLPRGLNLSVALGESRVAWLLLNANLAGLGTLNYSNLRPWALAHRKMLVLFGPAGSEGVVSINDAVLKATVPTGAAPAIHRHENLTLVILNDQQVDAAYLTATGLVVGAAGLAGDDTPLPLAGWPTMYRVTADGLVSQSRVRTAPRSSPPPRLTSWRTASLAELVTGASPAFRPIDGPRALESLGRSHGYGWYRLELTPPANRDEVFVPESADRLHLFHHGRPLALLGQGPGASDGPVALDAGGPVVVLADNLGRFNYGWHVGEKKGLWGHFHSVRPVSLPKPKVIAGRTPNAFVLGQFHAGLRAGEHQPADVLVWPLPACRGGDRGLILDLGGFPLRAMVLVNGKPLGLFDPHFSANLGRWVLTVGQGLGKGRGELRLALFGPCDTRAGIERTVRLYAITGNRSQGGPWAFAPWTVPAAEAFTPMRGRAGRGAGLPCWYRAAFTTGRNNQPLFLEPRGLSKGQIYLNGRNLGRYFVATADGKPVPPQERYYLPEPWIRTDGPNELLLFEEHGRSPHRCRLAYDTMGPYGGP